MRPLSEATKYVGRQKFIEAVFLATQNNDASATAFWRIWQDLSVPEQKTVPFDDIALAAGVHPNDLMAAAVNAAMVLNTRTSDLVYAAMAPSVVRQMMKSALRISGKHAQVAMLDRHKVLQHGSFLPSPHGQTINVNANAKSEAKSVAAAAVASAHPSVPSFLDDMEDLQPVKERVHRELLEATTQRVIDAEPE